MQIKKIIAVIISISLLFQIPAAFAASGTDNTNVCDAATALGLISEEMAKNPDMPALRGDVMESILRLFPAVDFGEAELPFSDLDQNNKYYKAVGAVYGLGIVNGYADGTIRPYEEATVGQIVKMMMHTLGYGELLSSGLPYQKVFEESRIPKIYMGMQNSKATVKQLAEIILAVAESHPVDINYYEKQGTMAKMDYRLDSRTLMERNRKIYKMKGQVISNGYVSLKPECNSMPGSVIIDGIQCLIGKTNAADYLGCYVDAYYYQADVGGERTLLHISSDEKYTIQISSEDITDYSKGTLYYMKDGKEKQAKFKLASIDVVRNMEILKAPSPSDFIFESGWVKVIDGDGNGSWDVVVIEQYETYVVDSINKSRETIAGKYGKEAISLDDYESVSFLSERGKEIVVGELANWDVLTVLASPSKSFIKITYSFTDIEGTIESVLKYGNNTEIVINGKTYGVTKDCAAYQSDSLKPGQSGMFSLNAFGKVAAVRLDDVNRYGWFIDAICGSGLDKNVSVKFMDENGTVCVKKLAEKVNVNGDIKKASEVMLAELKNTLAIYRVNSNGEITYVDTPYDENGIGLGDNENPNLTLQKYFDGYKIDENTGYPVESETLIYKSATGIFGGKIGMTDRTIIFEIPTGTDSPSDDDYIIHKLNDGFIRNDTYVCLQAYKSSEEAMDADVIVVYEEFSESKGVPSDTAISIITKITNVMIDGAECTKVMVRRGGEKLEYIVENQSVLKNLMPGDANYWPGVGDIVKIHTVSSGTVKACELLYSAKEKQFIGSNPNNTNFFAEFRVQVAYVYKKKGSMCLTTTTPLWGGVNVSEEDLEYLELRNLSTYQMIRYDSDTRQVVNGSPMDISAYKDGVTECSKLFIYDRDGASKTIVILD